MNQDLNQISPFKVYKPVEAAALLQVDKEAIYKAIDNGKLQKTDIGKGYRILGENLLRFMGSAIYNPQSISETVPNSSGAVKYQSNKNVQNK